MDDLEIERQAWKLLLSGAEAHVEDAMNEDGDFTDADYDRITERSMAIIRELRAAKVAGGNDGIWPPR